MMDNFLTRHRPPEADDDDLEWDRKDDETKRGEREAKRKEKLDDALDAALEDSFPGSDPVAVTQPPASSHHKRRP